MMKNKISGVLRAQCSSVTGNFGNFAAESKFEHQRSTILNSKNLVFLD